MDSETESRRTLVARDVEAGQAEKQQKETPQIDPYLVFFKVLTALCTARTYLKVSL